MTRIKKIKVLFTIPTLVGGGAEKMLLYLLNGLDRNRFSLFLALHNRKGVYADDIPGDIKVYDLKKRGRLDVIRIIITLAWKIFPRVHPDAVVSFIEYSNLVTLAAAGLSRFKPAVIISERTHPSLYHEYGSSGRIKRMLLEKLYPRADRIVTISQGIKEELYHDFKVPRSGMRVIYNCVDPVEIGNRSRECLPDSAGFDGGVPVLIACGRFKRAKNYPLLIKAFARVVKNIPAKLVIIGDGTERKTLETLVAGLGIVESVAFLGFQKNSFKYMARSDIFVLSSSWEGFGNVIIEAMACGVPVIATRCPSGPGEIITDGIDGLLVPPGDEAALAEAMKRLLTDSRLRRMLSRNGKKRSEDFHLAKMVQAYEEVIEQTTGRLNGGP